MASVLASSYTRSTSPIPRLALVAAGALCVACGSSPAAPSGTPSPGATVAYLQIVPGLWLIDIGQRSQLVAMATYSDKSVHYVTSQAAWQSDDANIVSVASSGKATALQTGTTSIRATYKGVTVALPFYIGTEYYEDCYGYDVAGLKIVRNGGGYVLVDGFGSYLAAFLTAQDAANGLALAQRYQSNCWLGRGNARATPSRYVVTFWLRPTGAATTIDPEDCTAYQPANLQIVSLGSLGWAVVDGATQIALVDDEPDATLALKAAQQYTLHCFIGRGNTQPNASSYVVEYWR